jgi:hypothetical protein
MTYQLKRTIGMWKFRAQRSQLLPKAPPQRKMVLSEKTIRVLQEILEEEYGREVSFAEATEIANALVGYFDLLAKIYHRDKKRGS